MAPAWFSTAAVVALTAACWLSPSRFPSSAGCSSDCCRRCTFPRSTWPKCSTRAAKPRGWRPAVGRGRFLLVAETALAVALLAGASLMISSYAKAGNVDLGYDPRHVLTMFFRLDGKAYYDDLEAVRCASPASRRLFTASSSRRIRNLPGVESAGIMSPFRKCSAGVSASSGMRSKSRPSGPTLVFRGRFRFLPDFEYAPAARPLHRRRRHGRVSVGGGDQRNAGPALLPARGPGGTIPAIDHGSAGARGGRR